MDEENDLIQSESITYPISELLADIGGAAGLFLGLSVVGKWSIIFLFRVPRKFRLSY